MLLVSLLMQLLMLLLVLLVVLLLVLLLTPPFSPLRYWTDNGAFYDSTNNHTGYKNHQEILLAAKVEHIKEDPDPCELLTV